MQALSRPDGEVTWAISRIQERSMPQSVGRAINIVNDDGIVVVMTRILSAS